MIFYKLGVGGTQLWKSDGTATGTVRAFDKDGNDIYINRETTNLNHPATFAIFGNSIYFSGNIIYENIPKGGFNIQNKEEYLLGFDQAVAVSDSDTTSLGLIVVKLSVDKGVIIISNKKIDEKNMIKKLHFLISLPISYSLEHSLLLNSLLSQGHSVRSVYNGNETMKFLTENIKMKNKSKFSQDNTKLDFSEQAEKLFDCVLLSLFFSDDFDGLEIVRNIRFYESLIPNSSSIPIFVFKKVNVPKLQIIHFFLLFSFILFCFIS